MHVKVKLSVPQLVHGEMLDTAHEHLVSEAFGRDFEKRGVGKIVGRGALAETEPVDETAPFASEQDATPGSPDTGNPKDAKKAHSQKKK